VHSRAKEVVLTDHQDHVVELARYNVLLNGCEARCKVSQALCVARLQP
jgi:23S rRNA G2069 N7-methylase RlmK/C1962 C5-methylase RlmI